MKNSWRFGAVVGCGLALGRAWGQAPVERAGGTIDLPSSKQILGVVPGGPQKLSSLPVSMAVSPDGRWVVTVNAGYGSAESGYMQGLAVLDTQTGRVMDYPDARTLVEAKQTLFSGLAFSADGKHVYASIASLTDPEGEKEGDTGSGVAVYSFVDGKVVPERVLKIPMAKLAAGRTTLLGPRAGEGMGVPYPAGIAVVRGGVGERLLVAGNLSDDVVLLDASGKVLKRFDLSESDVVPGTYPVAVVVSADGKKGYCALWNSSEVVELDLVRGTVGRKLVLLKGKTATAAGSHPVAMAIAADGKTMYVASSNRDAVAAVDLEGGRFALKGYFDARLPGQSYFGAEPASVAVSGSMLYAGNMGSNAVAVWDTRKLTRGAVAKGMVEPLGFVPAEWMPMGVAVGGGKLYVTSGKGTGTGPNNRPQPRTGETKGQAKMMRDFTYIPTLLHGSVAVVPEAEIAKGLPAMTAVVVESNRMKAAEEKIVFSGLGEGKEKGDSSASLRNDKQGGVGEVGGGPTHRDGTAMNGAREVGGDSGKSGANPIKHVIYIIRENRTYDQELGDLPVGNGDKSLTMYGAATTPNLHKLAMQFGVLDNFYDSAEVSGDGHVWSNSAIGTDYLERTWQIDYRSKERGYDYEGVVSEGVPLEQGIPDVNEPASGYLWGNLAAHGKTLYHFGEFISSKFCDVKLHHSKQADPREGPMREGSACAARTEIKPGEKLPEEWGGGVNKWPWAIPMLASNVATKPELVGHFAKESPDFNLKVPDQIRVDIFLKHLEGWVADRKAGKDTMPNFVMLRLANDHTAGTTAGGPSPKSSIADNDLAVGRAVEAISHSAFWDDTAFFVLEDDAQNGADHVDAHRSIGLVVSKYAPRAKDGGTFVDSRFYSTVSMVRTMETLLDLPPMNNNDAFASMIGSEFTGAGDQAPFVADTSNRENGLIYQANPAHAVGAKESAKMDFRHADRADARLLNVILWKDAMGEAPVPSMLTEKRKKVKKDDDD